jgi:hypothetical protein
MEQEPPVPAESPEEPAESPTTQQGEAVEIHPPHGPIRSFPDFLLQLLTITAGVLIALSLEGLLEWRHHRTLVREARENISREIADNKKELVGSLQNADGRKKDIDTALRLANELLNTGKSAVHEIDLGLSLAELSAASWQSAERTRALGHMEYSEVQEYSPGFMESRTSTPHTNDGPSSDWQQRSPSLRTAILTARRPGIWNCFVSKSLHCAPIS